MVSRLRTTRAGVPLLGAHMSIAGGVFQAILHAERAGCPTVQLFNKSSNQWRAKPLTAEEIDRFRVERERTGISPVVSHTAYLINCGSPDRALREKSVAALGEEYARCGRLAIDYLVMHPGAHVGSGIERGIQRIASGINTVLNRYPGNRTMILLESTAGAGTIIGSTFEELQAVIELIEDTSRVGICLDTCHLFAAGYDLRTIAAYRRVMRTCDRVCGLPRVKVWHLNDSRGGLGSRRDRHDHIGRGQLGVEAFRLILRDRRFARVPKILETPKTDQDRDMDQVNLSLLRELAAGGTKSSRNSRPTRVV